MRAGNLANQQIDHQEPLARSSSRLRQAAMLLTALALAACAAPASPAPTTPRPTAPIILEITVAPTRDIDATATVYARQLIPSPTPAGLYVVQPGDTLSALAEEFGSTVEEIMAANGLTDPNAVQAGQTLLIPSLIDETLVPGATAVTTATFTPDLTPAPTLATP